MTAAFDKNEVRHQAEVIAARVPEAVGLDPLLIITILTQVLPLIMNCGMNATSPKPEDIRDYVTERVNRGPKSRERLQKAIARRIRGEADTHVTKEQSLLMADAVIEEAMYPCSDDGTLEVFASECVALNPYA